VAWRLARRKPLGAVSALIVLGLVVVAVLAPVLAPRDPYAFNLNERGLPIRMQAPSAAFWLGTDPLGRDVLSRTIWGCRVSLEIGLLATALSLVPDGDGLEAGADVPTLLLGYPEGRTSIERRWGASAT